MDVQFDPEYNVGVVHAVPINVYDYYEPGEIKHFSWMKLFVPRGGKCQFVIKVLNFDGKITNCYVVVVVFVFLPFADESCTKFYVPDKNSPLTLGVCDGGSCKCVNGKLEQLLTLLSFIF